MQQQAAVQQTAPAVNHVFARAFEEAKKEGPQVEPWQTPWANNFTNTGIAYLGAVNGSQSYAASNLVANTR